MAREDGHSGLRLLLLLVAPTTSHPLGWWGNMSSVLKGNSCVILDFNLDKNVNQHHQSHRSYVQQTVQYVFVVVKLLKINYCNS